jgi:BirA family biotin operon repressor/biotin-[acetyl-CoA-carboxylase] ligase
LQVKNTIFIGKVLLHFDSLPSTNAYAQEIVSKSRPSEGTVVLTDHQTEGRGQIGSIWQSKPGQNLTFSIILYPKFLPVQRQFALSQAISLAIRDFLAQKTTKTVSVKWPNDIYIGTKKVCGILIQNTLSGKKIQSSIIGIGLNINQDQFADSFGNASSLHLETGIQFDLQGSLSGLIRSIESYYFQLKSGQLPKIQASYLQHLYLFQQPATFRKPGAQPFKAKIVDINPLGQLGLESQGKRLFYNIKEIQLIHTDGST